MYQQFFTQQNVICKNAPFGMKHVPSEIFTPQYIVQAATDVQQILQQHAKYSNTNICFPQDFVQFVQQVGCGTLGKVRIFAPIGAQYTLQNLQLPAQADISFHTSRFHQALAKHEEEVLAHTFPMHELIIFAFDIASDLFFAWRASDLNSSVMAAPIFVVDEHAEAPPPTKCAETFVEFCANCCLGDFLQQNNIKKTRDDNDEEENEEQEEASDEPKEFYFVPFAAGK